jgi:transaldolase
MKFFLDTASISEIKEVASLGILDGVTTNPTLISKERGNYYDLLKEICNIVKGPVSAEVTSDIAIEMIEEAKKLAKLSDYIVVKIPLTKDGLIAAAKLSKDGIKVNMTLIFSPTQALLACKTGATYLSPFVGRLDDIGNDGLDVALMAKDFIEIYGFNTQVIVASIRNLRHVIRAAESGIDIVTLPPQIFWQMLNHPLTDIGLEKFMKDWKEYQKNNNKPQ